MNKDCMLMVKIFQSYVNDLENVLSDIVILKSMSISIEERLNRIESMLIELRKLLYTLIDKLDEFYIIKKFEILKEIEKDLEELSKKARF